MITNTNFNPKRVTDINDRFDEDGNLCIRELLKHTQAIAHKVECHDKSANTDGYIELVDDEERPVGKLVVQAKIYKSKYKGLNKAEVPSYFVAYASRMRNEVCIFFSVDANENKIYWKYISDEYIRIFQKKGDNTIHVYQFTNDEIISKENVNETIDRWKQIFNEKIALLIKEKKSAEEVILENYLAFERINSNFHNLKDSFIERKEIGLLYKWVKEELPEKGSCVKLLVGNAGMGKSVIIKEVIQRLEADSIKCFAIKADKLQIPIGYTSNEHLELLRNAFTYLMQKNRAVLIIDQIDALSQYINSDRNKLENIITLINLFSDSEKLRNVRIVVSCRSFDLEFDPVLSILGREPQIKLGVLDKKDVKKVLGRLKVGLYNELDAKTISVLQTPQHLNLFCRVYIKNKKKDYYSITDLYDELWLQTIGLTESNINKERAEQILYNLALKIYRDETLTPQWDYETSEIKEANYLISEGIIENVDNRVAFFHQSMYDYIFARYYTKEKRSLIQDLLTEKKHQGLFVRSTVNYILDYERSKNTKQYKKDIMIILFSGRIRTHIQLMLLWAMANRVNILYCEKKCVKDLYVQNKLLFYSFIRRTYNKEWYHVITPLIVKEIKAMKKGDIVYENVYGYFWNHAQENTEEVFNLIDCIKDEETRNVIVQNVLCVISNYTFDAVTKWYNVLCNLPFEKAKFLERALPSNPKFVLDNISELIAYILNPQKKGSNHDERAVEAKLKSICIPLMKEHFESFYLILRDQILYAINNYRVSSWGRGIDCDNVFPLAQERHGMYDLHEWFGEMLKKQVKINPSSAVIDIKELLNQRESSCYEFAFKSMKESPTLFTDDIVAILKETKLVDELLLYSNITYYFLNLLREWFSLVDDETLSMCQSLIYKFNSELELIPDKKRSYNEALYPHLGYHQRMLIWSIPESLRDKQIKKRALELDRKFHSVWKNEKQDYCVTAASICGGLMPMEQYRTVSCKNWLASFYGIKDYVKGKFRYFDERVHADAFKQCVSERPNCFYHFVFQIFGDDNVPIIYKLAGLEGLSIANYSKNQLLPFIWKCIDTFDKLFKERCQYRLFEVIDNITNIEGEYIERITRFLKNIIFSEYQSKYDKSIECQFDKSAVNEMLNMGVNSSQGRAILSLAKIGKLPKRKTTIYDFFLKSHNKLSIEHQLTVMLHLQRECYDNDLYNRVMLEFANKPITDYLFLNSNRMHWFWCNDPDYICPYFKMILNNRRAKPILVQIMFFGMQYKKSKCVSKEMFDSLISQNEEEVIKEIIPLAYKHLSDDVYGEQSEAFLRKFAIDNRQKVRQAYLIWCSKMPISNIKLFKDLLLLWLENPIESNFHDIIKYLEKCSTSFPYECYECVKLLINSKNNVTYYEEELFKILLTCYRIFMDDDEFDKADEVMDVFDCMMLNVHSGKIIKILKEIEEN